MTTICGRAALTLVLSAATACGGGNTPPQGGDTAPGADRTTSTRVLETGANLVQDRAPVEQVGMYLNGFHVDRADPAMQFGLDTAEARGDRRAFVAAARPQGGVDAMAGAFPDARPIEGVEDNGDTSVRRVPTLTLADAPPQ